MDGILIAFAIILFFSIPLDITKFRSLSSLFYQWWRNILHFGTIVAAVLAYIYMPALIYPDILVPCGLMLAINASYTLLSSFSPTHNSINTRRAKLPALIMTLLMVLFIFFSILPLTQSTSLHQLPQAIIEPSVQSSIDTNHIRQVPVEFAEWKADKVIGDIGYKVTTGQIAVQIIHDRLFWISSLEFESFWKWLQYQESPGYVLVDAEDPEAKPLLIDKHHFKYLPSAYFSQNLHRKIYRQFPNYRFNDYILEIDESGKPWWVASALLPTIGFTGEKIVGVVLVDPESGDVSFHETIPAWVDRAFPEYLAEQYNFWYGAYIHGFINTMFSQKDMHIPTHLNGIIDVFAVYSKGELVWFTGHTSPSGSDQSMTGYATINTRTGKMIYYSNVSGYFNEEAAASAAESKVSNFEGYHASQPVFYVLEGQPAWIVPILSSNNNLQLLSIVNAETGQVVLGENLALALSRFGSKINLQSAYSAIMEGTIYRLNNGHLLLVGNSTIFSVSGPLADLSREGDRITLGIISSEPLNDTIKATILKNTNIPQR